jgi:DNA-binding response OmpR family regulator
MTKQQQHILDFLRENVGRIISYEAIVLYLRQLDPITSATPQSVKVQVHYIKEELARKLDDFEIVPMRGNIYRRRNAISS